MQRAVVVKEQRVKVLRARLGSVLDHRQPARQPLLLRRLRLGLEAGELCAHVLFERLARQLRQPVQVVVAQEKVGRGQLGAGRSVKDVAGDLGAARAPHGAVALDSQ